MVCRAYHSHILSLCFYRICQMDSDVDCDIQGGWTIEKRSTVWLVNVLKLSPNELWYTSGMKLQGKIL